MYILQTKVITKVVSFKVSNIKEIWVKKGNIIMIQILQSQQIVQSIVIVYGRNTKALPDIFHSIDCDLEVDTCRLNLWF